MAKYSHEVLAERVDLLVSAIPPGRASTYGIVGEAAGCGARQIARIIQELGGAPWWRLVNARGELPPRLVGQASRYWKEEGTPTDQDAKRVLLSLAVTQADELLDATSHPLPER